MFTTIGILLILVSVGLLAIKMHNKAAEDYNKTSKYHRPIIDLPMMDKWYMIGIGGVLVMFLNGLFFINPSGTATAIQYLWGGDKMVTTQGPKLKFWGKTIPLSYEISVKDIIPLKDSDGNIKNIPENSDGIYNRVAHRWEFSDAIKADIATSVIVGVSIDDEEQFLDMADRNRSEGKLITGRVLPNIDAALKNTCKLMDAQEYISGKASDFDRYFRDQLENGMYLVEEYVQEETVPEIIGDTNTIRTVAANKSNNKQIKYRIKHDAQGNIMRDNKSNTLRQYGITIYQAQVTGIDWEESFDERLELQKKVVAETQYEKQEAEKEFFRAKKEIAKGESEKAMERARLEKEQIKSTIEAETEAKVAEQNLIAEKKKFEVAQYTAKTKKELADAQAYENQKLVNAGLTPQERAKLQLDIANVVSKNISGPNGISLPQYYTSGSQGSNSNDPLAKMMEMLLAQQMINNNKP